MIDELPFKDLPMTQGQPPADLLVGLQAVLAPYAPTLSVALWCLWATCLVGGVVWLVRARR